MNTMKKILLTGLMTLLLSSLTFAQSFDTNRMNRDIRIMENILSEMFKTQLAQKSTKDGSAIRVRSNNYVFFSGGSSDIVKGTYIPGYGIIFMIPSSNNRISIVSTGSSEKQIVFEYSADDSDADRTIDQESVTTRISEFLKDYASTIGQLKPNENVMVIYGSKRSSNRATGFTLRADRQEEMPEPLPVISVSVKKSDLDKYRTGNLKDNAFRNQLSISTSEEKERLDLKVLGNIFGTALGDGDGNQFHLINSNSLSYLYLDNFGALYSLDIHKGHGMGSFSGKLFEIAGDDEKRAAIKVKLEEQEKKLDKTLQEEYDVLINKTKEFIVDYGRTLRSLKDDQYLLVSLNISDNRDIVPERVDFQVKKTVFSQLDQGKISREKALNAVTMTEY